MKKILLIFTAIILTVFPVDASFDTYMLEAVEPEICELTLQCNNQELKINTIPYKFDEYAPKDFSDQDYQYATIASALGYTTTYNVDTNEIISEKDGRIIKFAIDNQEAVITENGESEEVYFIESPYTYEGRTFISEFDLKRIFNVNVYVSGSKDNEIPTVNIYEYEFFKGIFKEKFDEYNSFIDTVFKIPVNNTETKISVESKFDFKSDTFGTSVKGSGKADLIVENGNGYAYLKLNSSSDGIFNLFKLGFYSYDVFDNENKENISVDLNKKDEFESFLTSEGIYLKSDDLLNRFIGNNKETKGKWVKVPEIFSGEKTEITTDEASEKVKDFVIDEIIYNYVDSNMYLSYDEIYKNITQLSELFDKKLIDFNEKTKTIKINCGADDFKKIIMFFGASEELSEWFNINIGGAGNYDDNGIKKGNGTVKYSLSNLPNPYEIEMGTVKYEMKISTVTNKLKKQRAVPNLNEVIKMSEYFEDEI